MIDQSIGKEIDSTPGGHGGPPLQFILLETEFDVDPVMI